MGRAREVGGLLTSQGEFQERKVLHWNYECSTVSRFVVEGGRGMYVFSGSRHCKEESLR